MNLPVSNADKLAQVRNRSSRRTFLRNAALAGVAAAVVPAAKSLAATTPTAITDLDILNFALNLEYLEAEFYAKAYYGVGLAELGVGLTGVGTQGGTPVYGNNTARVTFNNPLIYDYATEITNDEIAHVKFLREALGNAAIAEPQIDLFGSFNALAMATGLGNTFDPFASEGNFLFGLVHLRGRGRDGLPRRCRADHQQELHPAGCRHHVGRGVPRVAHPHDVVQPQLR